MIRGGAYNSELHIKLLLGALQGAQNIQRCTNPIRKYPFGRLARRPKYTALYRSYEKMLWAFCKAPKRLSRNSLVTTGGEQNKHGVIHIGVGQFTSPFGRLARRPKYSVFVVVL